MESDLSPPNVSIGLMNEKHMPVSLLQASLPWIESVNVEDDVAENASRFGVELSSIVNEAYDRLQIATKSGCMV